MHDPNFALLPCGRHFMSRRAGRASTQENQLAQDNQAPRNELSRPFICAFIVVDIIQKPKYLEKKK